MPSAANRNALFGIVGAVFVSSTGIGSLLPVLPLYLRDRGASYALVGAIVASALVAQAIGQWPAGRLAERLGRREMMVAGLLVAAVASVAFVLPLSVSWLLALRFVQGWASPRRSRRSSPLSPTSFRPISWDAPTAGWQARSRAASSSDRPSAGCWRSSAAGRCSP